MSFAFMVWLLAALLSLIRQPLRMLRGSYTLDWYSLFQFYLFTGYILPVAALFAGLEFPVLSFVHAHPGAAQSDIGGILLAAFAAASWVGYIAFRRASVMPTESNAPYESKLLIGFIIMIGASTVAWVMAFGGFVNAITSVMLIRFGLLESTSSVPWFTALTSAAWFACFLAIVALIKLKHARRDAAELLIPWTLIAVSILALLLRGSRGQIGSVLLSTVIYIYAARELTARKRRAILLSMAAVAVAVVVLFKPTMTFIRANATGSTVTEAAVSFVQDLQFGTQSAEGRVTVAGKLASELAHYSILSKLAYEYDRTHAGNRDHGRDILIGFGKLLPASVYEPSGYPLSYRSTNLMIGTWESQIPPGIIAWLLLTGGPMFVPLGAFLCGVLIAIAERFAVRRLRRSWWSKAGYVGFGMVFTSGIVGGTPGDLLRVVGTMAVVIAVAQFIGALLRVLKVVLSRGAPARVPAAEGPDV
jgi:hypothetical protein